MVEVKFDSADAAAALKAIDDVRGVETIYSSNIDLKSHERSAAAGNVLSQVDLNEIPGANAESRLCDNSHASSSGNDSVDLMSYQVNITPVRIKLDNEETKKSPRPRG